ncbi:MAG: hypothetical protein KatS3mg077_0072 [Candidatus Binatia bacterium]|nr:MAG: hypothetical protein KatS3mg077_0072 [Candidatus Binatia bacterium]
MRASEDCKVHEDGSSLLMPPGGRVATVTYAPKGQIRAAVFGRSLSKDETEVVLYFDGQPVERMTLDPGGTVPSDHTGTAVVVSKSGPHTWELEVRALGKKPQAGPIFQFEKLAIAVP